MVDTIPYSNLTTSKAAAQSVRESRPRLIEDVFKAIVETSGATCDECEVRLGASHQSTSSAIRRLVESHRIIDSRTVRNTRTGRAAIVWKVVTP